MNIFKGIASSLTIKVLGAIVGFLSNLLVAKALGADQAGLYFSFINFVWLMSTLFLFGVEQSSVRQIAISNNTCTQLLSIQSNNTILILMLGAGSAIFFIVTSIFNFEIQNPWGVSSIFLIASILLAALFKLSNEYLKGIGHYLAYNFFQGLLFSLLISLTVAIGYVAFDAEAHDIIFCVVVILLLCVLGTYSVLKKSFNIQLIQFFKLALNIKSYFREGISLWGATIADSIIAFSGSVVLIYFATGVEVSMFHINSKISTLLIMVVVAINSIYIVKVNQFIHGKDHKSAELLVKAISSVSLMVISIPVFIVVLFTEDLLNFFGKEFSDGELSLYILIIYSVFMIIAAPASVVLVALKRGKVHSNISLLALMSFVICIIFYGYDSALGMSVAVLFAGATKSILTLSYLKLTLNYFAIPTLKLKDILSILKVHR